MGAEKSCDWSGVTSLSPGNGLAYVISQAALHAPDIGVRFAEILMSPKALLTFVGRRTDAQARARAENMRHETTLLLYGANGYVVANSHKDVNGFSATLVPVEGASPPKAQLIADYFSQLINTATEEGLRVQQVGAPVEISQIFNAEGYASRVGNDLEYELLRTRDTIVLHAEETN